MVDEVAVIEQKKAEIEKAQIDKAPWNKRKREVPLLVPRKSRRKEVQESTEVVAACSLFEYF